MHLGHHKALRGQTISQNAFPGVPKFVREFQDFSRARQGFLRILGNVETQLISLRISSELLP